MSWFDSLQIGSFRGIEFLFADSDGELGRRIAVFEYPGRDLPYVEDLGRRARIFSLELIVAGPNYMAARDNLAAALEAPGPGILVHPTLGELRVSVYSAAGPRESTREGGTARFSVSFIESGESRYPAATADGRRIVTEKIAAANASLGNQLLRRLSLIGPSFISEDAVAQVAKMAATIHKGIVGLPELAGQTALMQDVVALSTSAASLIRDPIDLADAVTTIFGDIVTAVERPLLAFSALSSFWGYLGTGDAIPGTTASRMRQADNRTALTDLFVTGASISAAGAASRAEYDSQDAASAASLAVCAQLDVVSLSSDDGLYNALTDLRAAVVADLGSRPGLPRIVSYLTVVVTPALALAHRIYGDAARADDIVARNRISHPGFVPSGRALEVLNA
jgi:prophage DNA circulation protein